MAGDKAAIANVYLQWLSFGDAAKPTVVKSVPVKEINDQNLSNASIEIGGEEDKENEATIFVSSYDVEEDKDISLLINATKPGTYTVARRPLRAPSRALARARQRERLKPALRARARLRQGLKAGSGRLIVITASFSKVHLPLAPMRDAAYLREKHCRAVGHSAEC
jgi:hypothetical protein